MIIDEHNFLRYLYEHDTGEFHLINDLIKLHAKDIDEKELAQKLNAMLTTDILMMPKSKYDYEDPNHIIKFSQQNAKGEINTLDNFKIKMKIGDYGRSYYQQTYLAQDIAEGQKIVNDSILSTNKFIRYTFGAIVVGAILQLLYIMVSTYEAEKSLSFQRSNHQREQLMPPPMVKIYLHDSLQTPPKVK